MKAIETLDFNLPDRATRQAMTNGNLLNTSIIDLSAEPARLTRFEEINLRKVERLQNLLDLEQRVNARAFETSA